MNTDNDYDEDYDKNQSTVNPIDIDTVALYLSDCGPLAKIHNNFEERTVQIELLKKIANTFNENQIGIFEAGTGVGKSYAYLIPALIWADMNNERVIVSTGTINLQQQLCEKDIPMAKKIIDKDIKFLLMKGRQNYICRRRFEESSAQGDLFNDNTEIFEKIREWMATSQTGSKSELPFLPPENVWSQINSESDACLGIRCPYHTDCFIMRLRKEAASAKLIVVNHHLLFADIESRLSSGTYDDASVLPPYRHIIFDEAHGIESAATSFFSESFNRFKVLRQVNQLYRRKKNSETGFLCTLAVLSSNEEKVVNAYEMVSRIKTDVENLETSAFDLLAAEHTIRLYEKTARSFGPVITLSATLAADLGKFTALCREIMDGIDDADKEVPAYWESKILLRRLDAISKVLRDFSDWNEREDLVFWIQKNHLSNEIIKDGEKSLYVTFTETPLDIADYINAGVFEQMKSVVCTSATLKTGRDFSYWMNRSGASFAEKERIVVGDFPSPFPYQKNMLFAVPSDAPLPDEEGFQDWINRAILKLIEASDGRTLVLFTSYESLKNAFLYVQKKARNFKGALFRQGSDDNARLLENFRNDITSVLFATDSFWQGVDIPGESLSQVIIARLPFTVPNDPIFTARSESITKRGGSSFMELSLPEALIKFRQGVGRLMRCSTDRGAVVTLDRRIYEKRYGSIFLGSLPPCKKLYTEIDALCDAISSFIFA